MCDRPNSDGFIAPATAGVSAAKVPVSACAAAVCATGQGGGGGRENLNAEDDVNRMRRRRKWVFCMDRPPPVPPGVEVAWKPWGIVPAAARRGLMNGKCIIT